MLYQIFEKTILFTLKTKRFLPVWQMFSRFIRHNYRFFIFWEKLGFHISPNHYYDPLPIITELSDDIWNRRSKLTGININEKTQFQILKEFSIFKGEYDNFPLNKQKNLQIYYVNNKAFESVDGEILYCFIRHFKPKKIIEIGSGASTLLISQAIIKNREENNSICEFITIDPYPKNFVENKPPGLTKLLKDKVQNISVSFFEELNENDILFIDSSHVLKIDSDVFYEYLEILPRLNKGVLVHVHDIFLPAEYPRELIHTSFRFWNEQYLLQAFLTFNEEFEILWAGSFLHLNYPSILEKAFNSYNRDKRWPASFWIRRK